MKEKNRITGGSEDILIGQNRQLGFSAEHEPGEKLNCREESRESEIKSKGTERREAAKK